jgi:glycosyltransferase involved in cell wall biosynthesis
LIFLSFLVIAALAVTLIFWQRLRRSRQDAHQFKVLPIPVGAAVAVDPPSLAIVIPAYNEAINIADCIAAALAASDRAAVQVWVVDDQSTDETLGLAQTIAQSEPRLHVVAAPARPTDKAWVGKNWACAHVMATITTDYVLFVDADVRLLPGQLDRALTHAVQQRSDLLTLWPTLICGCWGEWLCQPIIASLFAVSFEFPRVNDPADPTIMAVGPFMLFRRSAYGAIGGHAAVAAAVVEDVELARRIQTAGLKLVYGLGLDIATVQMYRSLAGLWEGWTKNWYTASQRDVSKVLYGALIITLVYPAPLLVLLGSLGLKAIGHPADFWFQFNLIAAYIGLLLHYWLRANLMPITNIPLQYWWLSSVGGLIVSAIPIASWIKTETGWGWTWRGRPLSAPPLKGDP